MRVMVFVKATEDSEKGFSHTPEEWECMEAMGSIIMITLNKAVR